MNQGLNHDFILLDRSGSMDGARWVESINGVNDYVHKLAKDGIDTGVTLAVFDQSERIRCNYKVIRDRIIPTTWKDVTTTEVTPNGGTPLNDAILKMVAAAEAGNYAKCALIIVTDGGENASDEKNPAVVKAALARCKERGWTVLYLGADFDNTAQAALHGTLGGGQVQTSTANLRGTFAMAATKRGDYAAGIASTMDFSEKEKAQVKS